MTRWIVLLLFIGGTWWLLIGLTDSQIDTFQKNRHAWIAHWHTMERTLTMTWKKIG